NQNEINTVQPEQSDSPENTDQPEEANQTDDTNTGTESQCAPNEVFIVQKGCVDRELYLERLLLNTWNDDTINAARDEAGLKPTVECKEGEVLNAFGCAPVKQKIATREWKRPTIDHGQLYDNMVLKSSDGIPTLDRFKGSHGSASKSRRTSFSSSVQRRNRKTNENPSRDVSHTVGHNRPRSYAFLPGRKLQSQRKCRPYEVLARFNRCIRKRGKTGLYKHTDHQYGIQQRHQHEAFN
ncbi:hypothetical protein KR093_002319, partial [Drosophila rubida]